MDVSIKGEVLRAWDKATLNEELVNEILEYLGVIKGKDKVRVVVAATKEGKRFCIIE